MTKDELVNAIAGGAQERVEERLAWTSDDAAKDWDLNSQAYLREAKAILEGIEAAGWTVVPKEAAQALQDSTVLDALTGPPSHSLSRRMVVRDHR